MVKNGGKIITSRNKSTANTQSGEKVKKDVSRKKQTRLSADTKIILSLMKKQPQTTEELCKNAGVEIRNFKENRRKFLINEKIIKQLPDSRWALWDYPFVSKQKYVASDIAHLIEILEDEKIDQNARKVAEYNLWKCCLSDSEIVGGKNDLRSFFIRALNGLESDKGIVFDHIYTTLENYAAFQLQGEEDIQWMNETCYHKLLTLFNKISSIKVRNRILSTISKIYSTNELNMKQQELTKLLRKKFFDPKEDDGIASRCSDILRDWADDELKETLKNEGFNLARSWDTFWSRADDELKEMLEDVVSNMTPAEKDILEKRGLEARKKHYGI